jgi:hypothetical protein
MLVRVPAVVRRRRRVPPLCLLLVVLARTGNGGSPSPGARATSGGPRIAPGWNTGRSQPPGLLKVQRAGSLPRSMGAATTAGRRDTSRRSAPTPPSVCAVVVRNTPHGTASGLVALRSLPRLANSHRPCALMRGSATPRLRLSPPFWAALCTSLLARAQRSLSGLGVMWCPRGRRVTAGLAPQRPLASPPLSSLLPRQRPRRTLASGRMISFGRISATSCRPRVWSRWRSTWIGL